VEVIILDFQKGLVFLLQQGDGGAPWSLAALVGRASCVVHQSCPETLQSLAALQGSGS